MNRKENRILIRNLERSLRLPPLPWTPRDISPLARGQKPEPTGIIIIESPTGNNPNAE